MTLFYLLLNISIAANCPHQSERLGAYSFSKIDLGSFGCNISASASSAKLKKRRSYRFMKDGQMSVFTEIEGTKGASSTGGRFLYILPASGTLDMSKSGESIVKIRDTSGLTWKFDAQGNMKPEEKCNLKIIKEISWEKESTTAGQEGGFFLKSCPNSIIVDSGFNRGSSSAENPKGNSKVRDSNGTECTVNNEVVYKYVVEVIDGKKYYQPRIKPSKELRTALSKASACRELDLTPLASTAVRQKSSQQP